MQILQTNKDYSEIRYCERCRSALSIYPYDLNFSVTQSLQTGDDVWYWQCPVCGTLNKFEGLDKLSHWKNLIRGNGKYGTVD